jgi:selT/selW/selH-like putative selenoprotein
VAAELKQSPGVEAKLVAGGGGVFDVTVDGKLVFSKKTTHRFPEAGEIGRLVKG